MIELKGDKSTLVNIEIACMDFEKYADRKAALDLLNRCRIVEKEE